MSRELNTNSRLRFFQPKQGYTRLHNPPFHNEFLQNTIVHSHKLEGSFLQCIRIFPISPREDTSESSGTQAGQSAVDSLFLHQNASLLENLGHVEKHTQATTITRRDPRCCSWVEPAAPNRHPGPLQLGGILSSPPRLPAD